MTTSRKYFRCFTVYIAALLATMAAAIVYGIFSGSFLTEFSKIMAIPWGQVALLDLYTGFFLFGAWVYWREASVLRTILFFIPVLLLGNLASCLYILYAIYTSAGDIHCFLSGKRNIKC